jgi:predicted nucleic acid-binding protein
VARGKLEGRPVPVLDGFLAATAQVHGIVLATRNVRDFARLGIRLVNPWDGRATP